MYVCKTIITIATMLLSRYRDAQMGFAPVGPILVVVDKKLVRQWLEEIRTFTELPEAEIGCYLGATRSAKKVKHCYHL